MVQRELEGLLLTSLNGLKTVVGTENVVGEKIVTEDGTTVIPISRASFGFGMGGFETDKEAFSGASGGGVTLSPMGFLVISKGEAKMIKIDDVTPLEKAIDVLPDTIKSIAALFGR